MTTSAMLQLLNATLLVCVSCCILSALTEASDVVLNCLAFTFIGQIDDLFNAPLLRSLPHIRLPTTQLAEDYIFTDEWLVGWKARLSVRHLPCHRPPRAQALTRLSHPAPRRQHEPTALMASICACASAFADPRGSRRDAAQD